MLLDAVNYTKSPRSTSSAARAKVAKADLDTVVPFMLQFAPIKIIRQTERYMKWFKRLKDLKTKARIAVRIRRMEQGDVGDAKSVGGDVRELRLDFEPGYRIYFTERNGNIVILLARGDKSSQSADIKAAIALSGQIKEV